MNKNWKIKKLGEVCDFQRGLTYSKNDEVDFSENIVLRSNNVDLTTNSLDFSELKYINPNVEIPENKKVKKGSLLICTANGSKTHLGKVALIDKDYDYAFGGFMGLITPKNTILSEFLYYLMISDEYKKFIAKLSDGANINNLKFGDLENFLIPLPPLPDQHRIVSILDQCFAAIDKAKTNAERCLSMSKTLFESVLNEQLTINNEQWEKKSLGEIGKVSMCKRIFKDQTTSDGDIPFYKIGTFGREPDAYISVEKYNEYRNKFSFPKKGDVMISASGTIGRRVKYNGEPAYFQDSNIVWIDNDEKQVLNDYLYHFYGACK